MMFGFLDVGNWIFWVFGLGICILVVCQVMFGILGFSGYLVMCFNDGEYILNVFQFLYFNYIKYRDDGKVICFNNEGRIEYVGFLGQWNCCG